MLCRINGLCPSINVFKSVLEYKLPTHRALVQRTSTYSIAPWLAGWSNFIISILLQAEMSSVVHVDRRYIKSWKYVVNIT